MIYLLILSPILGILFLIITLLLILINSTSEKFSGELGIKIFGTGTVLMACATLIFAMITLFIYNEKIEYVDADITEYSLDSKNHVNVVTDNGAITVFIEDIKFADKNYISGLKKYPTGEYGEIDQIDYQDGKLTIYMTEEDLASLENK